LLLSPQTEACLLGNSHIHNSCILIWTLIMNLSFQLDSSKTIATDIHTFIVAGWAGRDSAAVEHHIAELAAIGVARPSTVPLFYRVAENQLTQASRIQVVGPDTSGEVEVLIFNVKGELYLSLTSDHTDRKHEASSVALSKQLCAKPVGRTAWRFSSVAEQWDELVIRSVIEENGREVVYQEGALSALRHPLDLAEKYSGSSTSLPEGFAMSCGTVPATGGIRPSSSFLMELEDPRTGRTLQHRYAIDVLPEIS